MLIINAIFSNGDTQNFGNPKDLYRYMIDEGYTEAKVKTQYIFDTIANMRMTLAEIKQWIEMGGIK